MFFFGFDATFNLKSNKQLKLEMEYENNLWVKRTILVSEMLWSGRSNKMDTTKSFENLGTTDQYFLFWPNNIE